MRFGEVTDSTGTRRPWDHNIARVETGVGYRFDRNTIGKLVYQGTRHDESADEHEWYHLVGAQLSVAF